MADAYQLSNALEVGSRRRRVRKGTKSCWECKRRKIRCTFAVLSDPKCDGCKRRETTCVGQEFHIQTPAQDRLSRVEGMVQQLTQEVAAAHNLRKNVSDAPSREDLLESTSPTGRQVIHTAGISAPASSVVISPSALDFQADENHSRLSQALIATWPSQNDIGLIAGTPVQPPWLLSKTYFTPNSQLRSLLQLPSPGAHPVLIAQKLLLLALYLQGIRSSSVQNIKGLSSSCHDIMSRVVGAATRLVTSCDELVDSVEGIECIMMESTYKENNGNLRSSWVALRRAMVIAQMLGLHRTLGLKLSSLKILESGTQKRLVPEHLWFRLVQSDRYLSLMLGLPQGSVENDFATPQLLERCTSLERMRRLNSVAAGRILQRSTADDLNDLTKMHEIDKLLQEASALMPPKWWVAPGLTCKIAGVDEISRIMDQMAHYHILSQLHLPYLLRSPSSCSYEYSKMMAINASREVLTRFVAFRTTSPIGSYCRGLELITFIAGTALCLAHLDARLHESRVRAELGNPDSNNKGDTTVIKLLAHQRPSDRGLVERAVECIEGMASAGFDAIALRIATILQHLLAIEAEVAEGASYRANVIPGGGVGEECSGEVSDGGNELHIFLPHFGTITIERCGIPSAALTRTSASVPDICQMIESPNNSHWVFNGNYLIPGPDTLDVGSAEGWANPGLPALDMSFLDDILPR